jgi:flagellar hook-length control protein FliK
LSPKAADAAADAAAPARRRTADVGASPVTRRIAEAAAQRASADQDSPAFAPSSPESRAAASAGARDSAQSTRTTSGDDRANIQDRASAHRQDIADRAPRPRGIGVTAATDAAVRASAQSAGTSAHDSQTGAGPSAPVASSRPAASAQPAPSLTFGLGSGLLTGAGPTLAPLHASNVDSTTWSSGETLPESTVNQIVQAIRLQWTNGAGEARITLEPDQFGDVTISVRVERGQVSARVEADTPVVREWLQSNQQTLRHGLAEQNLKLDRLEVAAPPQSRDADRREGGRQRGDQPPPRRQRQPQGQETFEVVA